MLNLQKRNYSNAKGYDYITLFVDLYQKAVVHISDGKDSQTVKDFVETLEPKQRNRTVERVF